MIFNLHFYCDVKLWSSPLVGCVYFPQGPAEEIICHARFGTGATRLRREREATSGTGGWTGNASLFDFLLQSLWSLSHFPAEPHHCSLKCAAVTDTHTHTHTHTHLQYTHVLWAERNCAIHLLTLDFVAWQGHFVENT